MEISTYRSDSGNRDLEAKRYPNTVPFIEILQKAFDLKAPLIVKTSYVNDTKPGAWYIKGYHNNVGHKEIRETIEDNVKNKRFPKRISYLIGYPE